MYDLSRSEILEAIESCGGQPAWIKQVENMLGHGFSRLAKNAPPSARLVESDGEEVIKHSLTWKELERIDDLQLQHSALFDAVWESSNSEGVLC